MNPHEEEIHHLARTNPDALLSPEGRKRFEQFKASLATDTSVPSEVAMAWQCSDCAGTGTFTAQFPAHPNDLAALVWNQHRALESKRHCMCPGHGLKFWPIKTEQRDALVKVADRLLTELQDTVEGLDPEEAAQVAEMRAIIDAAKS